MVEKSLLEMIFSHTLTMSMLLHTWIKHQHEVWSLLGTPHPVVKKQTTK
jgi:hypothetical protein